MLTRSKVRHALFRAKNNTPKTDQESQEIYDIVLPAIPPNETIQSFSTGWDIVLGKTGTISIIAPESDYDFVHSTCLKKAMAIEMNVTPQFSIREENVIQIVDASLLDNLMKWESYNKSWGVSIDYELKRIYTKLFKTVTNKVTDEMINNSRISDGTALTEVPSIPVVQLQEWQDVSKDEAALIDAALGRKK